MTAPTLKDIFALSAEVVGLATQANKRIATAESCTGGLIGAAITSISGSSVPFKGGIIAYDNAIKTAQLSVNAIDIEKEGAVSKTVALQMAQGALKHLDVDIAVSVTGIAGPGGGSEHKPVGTVWIGMAQKGQETQATLFHFGDMGRNKVRDMTCFEALKALKTALNET